MTIELLQPAVGRVSDTAPVRVSGVAARSPTRLAIYDNGETVSYGELDRSATILAAAIRRVISPGALVATALSRSAGQVIAMLAIWKAGGAVLSLDPAWPVERLRSILRESGCGLVVCGAEEAERLDMIGDPTVLKPGTRQDGDRDPEQLEEESCHGARPNDLAYVLYTSGTTGRPRGVQITHANLVNLVDWHRAAFALCPETRASHLASVGFDAAIWEVWPYLCEGASIFIVPDKVRNAPSALATWMSDRRISIAFAPTLLAEQLMRLDWRSDTALRFLLTGADTLHARPPAGLPFSLINNYGPTECTVVATSGPVEPLAHGSDLPSIGRPISHVSIHLLDEQGEPVAPGQIGEIYIGGRGVGAGYLGEPALTAERFIPDRWADDPDARLFRTGDLGALRDDGTIAFHGRRDDQVKIRGHRVEPDEVTSVLEQHPSIEAAVVIAAPGENGAKDLVGYVIPVPGESITAEALREHLASRLPDYSIPSRFVRLDALPVNMAGKLDRAALPAPSADNRLDQAAFAEATSPVEQCLAAILADVLADQQVGVDDNFFLVGGHSLLGTQLVMRAGEAFGVELTLRDLFEAPTVRELAELIEERIVKVIDSLSDDEALRLATG